MRTMLSFVAAAWLCGGALEAAQAREEVGPGDLRELQEELANLDEELQSIEAESPGSGPSRARRKEIRERAEEIREETIYLKVKMRRHRRGGGQGTGVEYDELDELRVAIRELRDDIAAERRPRTRDIVLSEGTEVVLRLEYPLSSKTAQREDRVTASVAHPVDAQGALAIPAGADVRGIVANAEPARRPSRSGRLELEFGTVLLDHTRLEMRSEVQSVEGAGEAAERIGTGAKAGIGAILGGVLGGVLGGREGAIVGVVLGGGGAVVATKGDDVELPAGTLVTVRLTRPLTVPREARGSRPRGASEERDRY